MKRTILFFAFAFACILVGAQSLYVGSYNIRNQNDYDVQNGNGWQQRCPVICDMINFETPDVFGSQEVLVGQLHDMLKALDGYSYIGVGRDDGKEGGEYSPIFYKTAKFKLLGSGHFWLSEDTTRPNKGWDAACIRICTWGHFEDRNTKWRFWYFNLHMDHMGIVARRESAKLVVSKIRELCKGAPVVLTGDFNVDQKNEIYTIFTTSGILKDSYVYAKHRFAENGTFNDFNSDIKTDSRIDHIFVSPSFSINNYAVLTNCYWTPIANDAHKSNAAPQEIDLYQYKRRTPSDHYPVMARIAFNRSAKNIK